VAVLQGAQAAQSSAPGQGNYSHLGGEAIAPRNEHLRAVEPARNGYWLSALRMHLLGPWRVGRACVNAQAAAAAPLLRFHTPDADLAIVDGSLGVSEGGHDIKSDQCSTTL